MGLGRSETAPAADYAACDKVFLTSKDDRLKTLHAISSESGDHASAWTSSLHRTCTCPS